MNEKIYIEKFYRIRTSPAYRMALDACAEISDIANEVMIPIFRDSPVLCAMHKNKCIGFIHYHDDEDYGYCVRLGYVVPEFRKNGVYKKLFNSLIEEAKNDRMMNLGRKKILSYVSTKNEKMIKLCKKQKRKHIENIYVTEIF